MSVGITIGTTPGMSTIPVGLSSGSCPEATASALADEVSAAGGSVVDLRLGKGHHWEEQGISAFERAGLAVAFVGIGLDLGDEHSARAADMEQLARALAGRRLPVKVFAAAALDRPGAAGAAAGRIAQRQLTILERTGCGPVLVETHHGHASARTLDRLCADAGLRLVFDVLGWYRLTGRFDDVDDVVARYAVAGQVKGFRPGDTPRHEPLTLLPDAAWPLVDRFGPQVPVTVETRAGTAQADLEYLRRRRCRQEVQA
jgi:hypothetical protein